MIPAARGGVRIKPYLFAAVCALVGVALLGCQDDEVHRYQVPHEEPLRPDSPAAKTPLRLLAVIVPRPERTWFFKLVGPVPQVDERREEFDRFIQSVHFADGANPPVTWTAPEGWKQEPGSGMRFATFRLGAKKSSPELTVTPLSGEAGSLLANVNRWRGQIGLPEVAEADLGKLTSPLKVDGVPATRVDMTGPGGSGGMEPPFASRGRPAAGEATPRLTYKTPAGWKEEPNPQPPRVAAFQVSDGSRSAEVTVIPFPGSVGGLAANVNRWRGQLKLPPADEDELRREVQQTEVAGEPAPYVDLSGPESAGTDRQRILGAVLRRGGQSWFFTLKGPADLVGRQKAAFEEFLKSVRLGEGPGASNG